MCDKTDGKNRKKATVMATLAKPNTSSYIIKKESVPIIVGNKNSQKSRTKMKERAKKFRINNLKIE